MINVLCDKYAYGIEHIDKNQSAVYAVTTLARMIRMGTKYSNDCSSLQKPAAGYTTEELERDNPYNQLKYNIVIKD